jgi:excisionase family DNA binding protein
MSKEPVNAQRTPLLLSINDAIYQLNLSRTKIYELVSSKELKSVTVGRRRFIPAWRLMNSSRRFLMSTRAMDDHPTSHPRRKKPRVASHNSSRFSTVQDVAEQLDVSERSMWRWIKSGDLIAHKFGKAVRISDRDLADFFAHHRDSNT